MNPDNAAGHPAAVAMGLYLRSRHPELGARLREQAAGDGSPPLQAPQPGPQPGARA